MFSTEFLHRIREHEMALVARHMTPGAKVLEVGGGTGLQAKLLSQRGFEVKSVDLADSQYVPDRVFDVIDYDGRHLPFADGSFDVVFSSNVLEHVPDLPALHLEVRRVLKPDGNCLHAMPTGSWRFWTIIANYVELAQRIGGAAGTSLPRGLSRGDVNRVLWGLREMAKLAVVYAVPPRHGETGNAVTEISSFGVATWKRHFREQGFEIDEVVPMALFYTGHMVLGAHWSLGSRGRVSRLLGSACVLYRVTPLPVPVASFRGRVANAQEGET